MAGPMTEGSRSRSFMVPGGISSLKRALTASLQSPRSETSGRDNGRGRSSSTASTTCQGSERPGTEAPSVAASLERLTHSLAADPWPETRFEHITKLQEAVRNQGSVELMFDKGGIGKVAVKRMPNEWMQKSGAEFAAISASSSEQPWYDLAIVQWLNSKQFPYTCALHGIFQDSTLTYVVFELASEGDLFGWCQALTALRAEREKAIRPVLQKICSAVAWLHDFGIAHRDISLENILLTKGESTEEGIKIRLIDFGMASTQRPIVNEVRGKCSYQAPEMHDQVVPYDPFLTDVFAIGVTSFCIATQDYPWTSTTAGACPLWHFCHLRGLRAFLARRKLRRGRLGEMLSDALSAGFIDYLEGMLAANARERLTLGETVLRDDHSHHHLIPHLHHARKTAWDMAWLNSWAAL